MKCRLCGNEKNNAPVTLCGTMYGTKGEFDYFRCRQCGTLQICDVPSELSEYYSSETYYAFNMDKRKLKNRMLLAQMKHQLFGNSLAGACVQFLYPVEYSFYRLMNPAKDYLLDVGCGQGEMLVWLRKLGFQHLAGVDPYLEKSAKQNEIAVYSTDLCSFHTEQKYKMITFIHSFEHLPNCNENLLRAGELLEEDGFLVIQLPFLSSYYYGKYGKNLYTLDPPRHIFIPTYSGMRILADRNGFEIVDFSTKYDPAIAIMARNVKKNDTLKNQGTGLLSGTVCALLSQHLKHKLEKKDDGAIATFVLRKIRKQ